MNILSTYTPPCNTSEMWGTLEGYSHCSLHFSHYSFSWWSEVGPCGLSALKKSADVTYSFRRLHPTVGPLYVSYCNSIELFLDLKCVKFSYYKTSQHMTQLKNIIFHKQPLVISCPCISQFQILRTN